MASTEFEAYGGAVKEAETPAALPIGEEPEPYGSSTPPALWLESDAECERRGPNGSFNVLSRLEALVRTWHSASGGLSALLHGRCTGVERCYDFDDVIGRELRSASGKALCLELLSNCHAASRPCARMEPAEVLPGGETRVHWVCERGKRYALQASWSDDGLATRLVLVAEPPPTHREFVGALQSRRPQVTELLAADVMLHDTAAAHGTGVRRVLPALLRWTSDATASTVDASAELRVSRTRHLPVAAGAVGRRTRVHIAGCWSVTAGAAPAPALLEQTLEWRPSLATPCEWRVWRIWHRTLALHDASPRQPLPMNVYAAAGLVGSRAVLYGPGADDDDGGELSSSGHGRRLRRRDASRQARGRTSRKGGGTAEESASSDSSESADGSHASDSDASGHGDFGADADADDLTSCMRRMLTDGRPSGGDAATRGRAAVGGALDEGAVGGGATEPPYHLLLMPSSRPGAATAPRTRSIAATAGWRGAAAEKPSCEAAHAAVARTARTARTAHTAHAARTAHTSHTSRASSGGEEPRGAGSAARPPSSAGASLPPAVVLEAAARVLDEARAARPLSSKASARRELEQRVEAEVRRVRVRERWGRLCLRVRVRGAVALAALERARRPAAGSDGESADDDAAGEGGAEGGAGPMDAAAMAYAGLKPLLKGARSGELLDVFEAATGLVQLQAVGDPVSMRSVVESLADAVVLTHTSGHAGAEPSSPPLVGKAAVVDHLKLTQIIRTKGLVRSMQPAALTLEGRTRVNFEVRTGGGAAIERLQDVIEWDDAGKVRGWVRVFEPRPSQRDWLTLISSGKTGALGELLDPRVRFAMLDGAEPTVYAGHAPTLEALTRLTFRMAKRVSHIGRTREVAAWRWPPQLAQPADGGRRVGPGGAPAPLTVQAVLLGAWRPLGAKWYGEEEVALRETAEWVGRRIVRLVWEPLPNDHPQAVPVWQRLRAKRREQAARRRANTLRAAANANGNRSEWSNAQPYVPAPTKNGLKSAADKEMAPRPAPPPTLPPARRK